MGELQEPTIRVHCPALHGMSCADCAVGSVVWCLSLVCRLGLSLVCRLQLCRLGLSLVCRLQLCHRSHRDTHGASCSLTGCHWLLLPCIRSALASCGL
ncbi:hypothetical protein M3J09_001675 [Ascochyta lentis]